MEQCNVVKEIAANYDPCKQYNLAELTPGPQLACGGSIMVISEQLMWK